MLVVFCQNISKLLVIWGRFKVSNFYGINSEFYSCNYFGTDVVVDKIYVGWDVRFPNGPGRAALPNPIPLAWAKASHVITH